MSIYNWRVCSAYVPTVTFDLANAIDTSHVDSTLSPIDQFAIKNIELNALLLDPNNFRGKLVTLNQNKRSLSDVAFARLQGLLFNPASISPVLANLVLLGHISAVESYIRILFRKVINVDQWTQKACYNKELNYGAVLAHDKLSIPDSLLEFKSLSSKKNIQEVLKDYFGYKGGFPNSFDSLLNEFAIICQIRHSVVHKFGILGPNNIMHDFDTHRNLVNKPVKNDFASIQNVSQICKNVVIELNQMIWQLVMMRLIADYEGNNWKKRAVTIWSWNWQNDRLKFKKYFDLFYSSKFAPTVTDAKSAYINLKSIYTNM